MAILKGGLLGTSQKKIGSVVTYVVKGRTLARSKAATYNDKKSPAQVLQRSRQTVLVALARLLLGTIRTSFQSKKPFESGYNAFMSNNNKPENFGVGTSVLDYSNVIVSKGTLLPCDIASSSYNNVTKKLSITWANNANGVTGFNSDRIFVCVASSTNGKAISIDTNEVRASESASVEIPADWFFDGNQTHIYMYLKSQETDTVINVSDTRERDALIEI